MFFVSADSKEITGQNWMLKQKRQQGCWRYRILDAILLKEDYTLGDTFCQEKRQNGRGTR